MPLKTFTTFTDELKKAEQDAEAESENKELSGEENPESVESAEGEEDDASEEEVED